MPNLSSSFHDVAVIGLGAMGAAALYQLARRGVKAVGIDRFSPPHPVGSTHGETRITRQAVGEGEVYVPLVLRSNAIWEELEAETGESLLVRSGCLIVGPTDGPSGAMAGFLKRTQGVAQQHGIAHEMLDAAEIRRRYVQFAPQDRESGYFEPGGGYLRPELCVSVQLARAGVLGASLHLDARVLSVEPSGEGVRIATDRGILHAGQAVVSAGAWTPALLGAPFDRILAPSRQVMHWYPVTESHARCWDESPVFIWSHGAGDDDFFYGFPSLPGSGSVKSAGEQYDAKVEPDRVERSVNPLESRTLFDRHLAGRLNGLSAAAVKAVTCLYTVTPDRHFLIDRHPGFEQVLVVSPCSGHGFKHSAAIGEAAAEIVTAGSPTIDLSAFALSRFDRARIGEPNEAAAS